MPYVQRKIRHESEATFGVVEHVAEFHVPAHKVRRGDIVVPPARLPKGILADLAATHPEEYEAAARARKLSVGVAPEAFPRLAQKAALELVRDTEVGERLLQYFETELVRVPRRPAVMRAFAEKGLTPESLADETDSEPEVDTSDLADDDEEEGDEEGEPE